MAEITVDTTALTKLANDITAAKYKLLEELTHRGAKLLSLEVPVQTGNLKQGVGPPEYDFAKMTAILTVNAKSPRSGGGVAQVFGADGKFKKTVSLRPQPAYNYADVIARGNLLATLTPRSAQAFLVPITTNWDKKTQKRIGYLMIGGQMYRVVKSKKGMPPNPFDQRAADRLSQEAPSIADAVLRQFV